MLLTEHLGSELSLLCRRLHDATQALTIYELAKKDTFVHTLKALSLIHADLITKDKSLTRFEDRGGYLLLILTRYNVFLIDDTEHEYILIS